MTTCNEHRVRLHLYLDDELDDADRHSTDAHLKDCSRCRELYNEERWFLECLQKAKPLYVASDEIRNRVANLANASPPSPAPAGTQPPPHKLISRVTALLAVDNRHVIVVLLLLIVGSFLWGLKSTLDARRAEISFAAMAVDVHQRYRRGQLPLELATDDSEKISTWFRGKVSFSLTLPNYQEVSGQEKFYQLSGARLVGFRNDYAAYIAYNMGREPISLVVTSGNVAEPSGAEQFSLKGLIFHYDTIAGLKVISWTHHGLLYALVSDLDARGEQSCQVCHQGANELDVLSKLAI